MAKSRKGKPGIDDNTGLELPFPSAPSRPGKYALYFLWGDKRAIQIFSAKYSARKYLDAVLDGDEFEMITKSQMVSSCGIEVRCDFLQEIVDHKYSKAEADWELPHPYPKSATHFRYGDKLEEVSADEKPKKADKPVKTPKPKKERKPRPSREGLTSVGDLAKEFKMLPREARAILRKSHVEKPEAGWAWPDKEAKKIRKLLEDSRD